MLEHVPAHDASHGFRRGRSAVTHAANHSGTAMVVRVDLADFFLSIGAAQVRAIFAAMGYPSEVAWLLTCLTTNIAPVKAHTVPPGSSAAVIQSIRRTEMLARTRHLPQGAPTSPALANLAAYGLDVRLSRAAEAVSARYSRYADDLVFSGDGSFTRRAIRFIRLVDDIARDEGFVVNRTKTRVMRKGSRQTVTSIVVNERPTLGRAEAERLEAILFNCVRYGPASQNRDAVPDFRARLRGLVAHARGIDTKRSARLAELFDRICWN
jgi:retron-type reverse transcriptase